MSDYKSIGYVYSEEIKGYDYGDFHPMKTKRVQMTHDLLYHYGVLDIVDCYVSTFLSI